MAFTNQRVGGRIRQPNATKMGKNVHRRSRKDGLQNWLQVHEETLGHLSHERNGNQNGSRVPLCTHQIVKDNHHTAWTTAALERRGCQEKCSWCWECKSARGLWKSLATSHPELAKLSINARVCAWTYCTRTFMHGAAEPSLQTTGTSAHGISGDRRRNKQGRVHRMRCPTEMQEWTPGIWERTLSDLILSKFNLTQRLCFSQHHFYLVRKQAKTKVWWERSERWWFWGEGTGSEGPAGNIHGWPSAGCAGGGQGSGQEGSRAVAADGARRWAAGLKVWGWGPCPACRAL